MKAAVLVTNKTLTWQTPAYVNSSYKTGSGVTSLAALSSWTPDLGNFLVVLTSNYTTGKVAVSSVTDTVGNLYQKAGVTISGDGNHSMECWYATDNLKAISNTITVNFAASANSAQAYFLEFSKMARRSSVFDSQSTVRVTASGTSHTTNATSSLTSVNEMAIACFVLWGGTAGAYTGGDCTIGPTNGSNGCVAYKTAVGGTSPTLNVTTGATDQQCCGVWSFAALQA